MNSLARDTRENKNRIRYHSTYPHEETPLSLDLLDTLDDTHIWILGYIRGVISRKFSR